MSTFVLVHGAYHGAWCWYKLETVLESRGHDVVTFDLPGHGVDTTPVGQITFDDYVQAVCSAIDESDEPIVLVGHSMSGMVITQAAERCPESIGTLVYLTAYLPADGESMLDQRVEGSFVSQQFVAHEELGVGAIKPDALEELFYADCSPTDVTLARSLVRAEPLDPLRAAIDITPERFGSIPRVYIRCEEDRAITAEQQRRMIDERGCDRELMIDASHSPFLSMPTATADVLETAAER